jgi:hypothetical protein
MLFATLSPELERRSDMATVRIRFRYSSLLDAKAAFQQPPLLISARRNAELQYAVN